VNSSQARRATVERYFAAVDANDLLALLQCFDDRVVYERPGYPPLRGHDELREFYRVGRVIRDGTHDVAGIVVEGRSGAAWGAFTGVSRTGEPLQEMWCDVYQFSGTRIAHRRTHFFRAAI
jgi:ketosteroid isomerase-like protein